MRTLRVFLVGTAIVGMLGGLGSVVVAQDATDQAVEPDSILFVGNSFTYFNDGVENHVAALAAAEDPPRDIAADASTMGGATLKIHHQMSEPDSMFGAIDAIRVGAFDVVVLQDDIPEYYEREVAPFLEYARLFDQEIKEVGADTVFFMTWPDERASRVATAAGRPSHRHRRGAQDVTVDRARSRADCWAMLDDCPMSEDCPAYDCDARVCLVHPGDCEFSPADGEATLVIETSEVRTPDTSEDTTAR